MNTIAFKKSYGISMVEFASIIHVDTVYVRRFMNGEELKDPSLKKIEVGLSIFDNDLFRFEPHGGKHSDYYLDKLEKIENWERQVQEFTDIFNECMNDEEYLYELRN